LSRRLTTGALLLAPTAPEPVLLNEEAAAIWDLLDGPTTVDDLVHLLAARYGLGADVLGPAVAAALDGLAGAEVATPVDAAP
jgi:hypothetical protein